MSNGGLPIRARPDGIALAVRLTPKASADQVIGVEDGPEGPVLRAKVRAVPDKGKANQALVKLISKWLGVPQSSVTLLSGGKSRSKTLAITGDPGALSERIRERLAGK